MPPTNKKWFIYRFHAIKNMQFLLFAFAGQYAYLHGRVLIIINK